MRQKDWWKQRAWNKMTERQTHQETKGKGNERRSKRGKGTRVEKQKNRKITFNRGSVARIPASNNTLLIICSDVVFIMCIQWYFPCEWQWILSLLWKRVISHCYVTLWNVISFEERMRGDNFICLLLPLLCPSICTPLSFPLYLSLSLSSYHAALHFRSKLYMLRKIKRVLFI